MFVAECAGKCFCGLILSSRYLEIIHILPHMPQVFQKFFRVTQLLPFSENTLIPILPHGPLHGYYSLRGTGDFTVAVVFDVYKQGIKDCLRWYAAWHLGIKAHDCVDSALVWLTEFLWKINILKLFIHHCY